MKLDTPLEGFALSHATYEAAGYEFVGTKTFPDIDWAGATALYEKQLPS